MLTNNKPQVQSSRHRSQSAASENTTAQVGDGGRRAGRAARSSDGRTDHRRRTTRWRADAVSIEPRTGHHSISVDRFRPPVHSIPVVTLMPGRMHPNVDRHFQFLVQSNDAGRSLIMQPPRVCSLRAHNMGKCTHTHMDGIFSLQSRRVDV